MENECISIGVVIPTLNEAKNIKSLLERIVKELHQTNFSICIVDDGSTDQTIPIIQKQMSHDDRIHLIQRVKTKPGCQRGGASRCALEWLLSNTDHALFVEVDADGANQPEELLSGAKYIVLLGFDVVIGSKYVSGSKVVGRSFGRRLISIFYSRLARLLINRSVLDYSNSFRFYSRSAAKCILNLKPRYTSPIYLLEVLVMWIANHLKIVEIPILYVEREEGNSKVIFLDLIKGFLGMLAIAFRYRLGRYRLQEKKS